MSAPPGPTVDALDALLRTCIHCGLCLNACPTYRITGDEAESPRGRLVVLRGLLAPEPDAEWAPDRGPIDRCLGCRACETACPSGVPYGQLLEAGRAGLPEPTSSRARLVRALVRHVLPHRRRLALVAGVGQFVRRMGLGALLPDQLRGLLDALPQRRAQWPRHTVAARGGEVALLTGCAQSVFTPEVVGAVRTLVEATGARAYAPPRQSCCGALAAHEGMRDQAVELARSYLSTFGDADEVVVAAAGCSAHLRHLDVLFEEGGADARRARDLAARTHDFVPWLAKRSFGLEFRHDPRRVAYHPACHHLHAQRLDGVAEGLLDAVPGLQRVAFPRVGLCCGSAGAWSLHEPGWSSSRRDEKLQDILSARPDLILTANPGCELFLDGAPGEYPPVEHLAVYLARQLRSPR